MYSSREGSFPTGQGTTTSPEVSRSSRTVGQRFAHGRRGLAEGDDEDAFVRGQVELAALDPDDVALALDALADEAPRIDGRQGGAPDGLGVVGESALSPRGIDHDSNIAQTAVGPPLPAGTCTSGTCPQAPGFLDRPGGADYDGAVPGERKTRGRTRP